MTATAVKTKTAAAAAAHSYGWVPDIPDQRDIPYTAPLNTLVKLPAFVDLRDGFPTPYDQGNLGSCTANALAGLMQFVQKKEGMADFTPSRLFIYYEERKREHTITSDSGAMLRDGMKVLHTVGAPPETLWPYDITKFTVLPPAKAYAAASGDEALQYKRVYRTLNQFRGCLAEGYPFTVGIAVYESFEHIGLDGVGQMPAANEQLLGGHAILVVGYDDRTERFLFRNSWGADWGDHGYFTLPYAYLMNHQLASDFWTVRRVGAAGT